MQMRGNLIIRVNVAPSIAITSARVKGSTLEAYKIRDAPIIGRQSVSADYWPIRR
jgi:hypothetical protein